VSTTNVRSISNARESVRYQLYGSRGSKNYRENLAARRHRAAAISCDMASPEEFVKRAELLAETNGRKVEAQSVIQSFESTEFDPKDPADVQRVNDLGYMLAKELHPNSDCLVVTHTDGAGGHAHNHITVINHDDVTGRALSTNKLHWQVAQVNDALMRDQGCRVVEHTGLSKDQNQVWEMRRDGAQVTDFDRDLGDRVEEALLDERTTDTASFRAVLEEKGVELREKAHTIKASADGAQPEHESVGWTYAMRDETGPKPRVRRRKASSLSEEFTHDGAKEIFAEKERMARDARVHDEQAARAAQRARERVLDLDDLPEVDRGDDGRPGGDRPEPGEDRPVPEGRDLRREPAEDRAGAGAALDEAVGRLDESRRQREEARRDRRTAGEAGDRDQQVDRAALPDRADPAPERGERHSRRARIIAAHQEHQRGAEGDDRSLG
jgi:hypothetical protein